MGKRGFCVMTEVIAKKSKCSRFNGLNAAELALRTGMMISNETFVTSVCREGSCVCVKVLEVRQRWRGFSAKASFSDSICCCNSILGAKEGKEEQGSQAWMERAG